VCVCVCVFVFVCEQFYASVRFSEIFSEMRAKGHRLKSNKIIHFSPLNEIECFNSFR